MTTYDPKTFGAAADGVADDTAAILTAVYANFPNPTTVLFTNGIYHINGNLPISEHCTLQFDGGTLSLGDNATVSFSMKQDIDVSWFGANGLLQTMTGSINAESNVLSGIGYNSVFVGSSVAIEGAGDGGGLLVARVLQNVANATLILDKDAVAGVTNANVYKADDVAFRDAMRCHPGNDRFYHVTVPRGLYGFVSGVAIPNRTAVFGAGREQSYLSQYNGVWDDDNGAAIFTCYGGGEHIKDLMFVPQATGAAINHEPVSNDSLIESCWFAAGGTNNAAMLGGVCQNLTVTNCVFEQADYAIEAASNYLSISNCIFFDIGKSCIFSPDGGNRWGLNIYNCFFEVVHPKLDSVAIDIKNYRNVVVDSQFLQVVAATSKYSTGIKLDNCQAVDLRVVMRDFADTALLVGDGSDATTTGNIRNGLVVTDGGRVRLSSMTLARDTDGQFFNCLSGEIKFNDCELVYEE